MRSMRKGYFTPPVLIILAIIIFAVALFIAFNTDLVKKLKKEPTPTPASSPTTQQPTPTPDEAKNWETYTNSTLGIEFRHPNSAEVKEDGPFRSDALGKAVRIFFLLGDESREEAFGTHLTEGLVIDVMQIDNKGKSLYELADKATKTSVLDGERKEFSKIIIDGEEGYKAVFGPNEFTWLSGTKKTLVTSIVLYFQVNGKLYYFYSSYAGIYTSEYRKIYDQILSTFQFID